MRYLKMMAIAGLAAGLGLTVQAGPTFGVGGASGALYNDDYHMGYGVSGSIGQETMNGASELAINGNWLNYQSMEGPGDQDHSDLNEGGVGVTGFFGPAGMLFQPKIGAHVGYTRFEDTNFLDVGPDVTATYKVTPQVGIQAGVTPTWLINEDGNDYRTRASLGVKWTPDAG